MFPQYNNNPRFRRRRRGTGLHFGHGSEPGPRVLVVDGGDRNCFQMCVCQESKPWKRCVVRIAGTATVHSPEFGRVWKSSLLVGLFSDWVRYPEHPDAEMSGSMGDRGKVGVFEVESVSVYCEGSHQRWNPQSRRPLVGTSHVSCQNYWVIHAKVG